MLKKLLVMVALFVAASSFASAQSKLSPPEEAGGAYFEFVLGLHLESMGDAAGATAAYQRAEQLDPKSAEIPAALAAAPFVAGVDSFCVTRCPLTCAAAFVASPGERVSCPR